MGEDTKVTTSIEEEVHGKHHGDHGHTKHTTKQRRYGNRNMGRTIASVIVALLILAAIACLIVWLIYRPNKPRYAVLGATIITNPALDNNSTPIPPYLITASMQFTIATTNPNKRTAIYYDNLSAFVTYRNQMITVPTTMPPFFHDEHSTVQMAPIIGGTVGVPVSPEVLYGLGMDEVAGVVPMRLVLVGRIRWKAGAIKTAHYHIYVHCDVLVRLTRGFVGQAPLLSSPLCKVDA